jgi:BirA family biotin operon repressor/biotin-[acetyl-CoA-carboxylase] ligase
LADVAVLEFAEVGSTNDVALTEGRARDGAALGLLGGVPALAVLAARQTAGRGRAGRSWASPAGGGMYLSIYLRPGWPAAQATWLTLAAALAARQACAACGVRPLLKWPNDLLAPDGSGRKLAGILVETRSDARGRVSDAVLGIGINLRAPAAGFPGDVAARAATLEGLGGRAVESAVLAQAVLAVLGPELAALAAGDGGAAFLARAREASDLWGRRVRFEQGGAVITGVARDLAPDGGLVLELDGGERRTVHAGDVLPAGEPA